MGNPKRELGTRLQLQLSLRRKKGELSHNDMPPRKRKKGSGGVFSKDILYPPGFKNLSNNCYSNAILQCLFNHQAFVTLLEESYSNHPQHCNADCCTQLGMWLYLAV